MAIRRRVFGRLTLALLALAGLGALLLVQAAPASAALICPRCMGFVPLGGGVYADSAMSEAARARFARTAAEGEARAAAYLDGLSSHPTILVCATPTCHERMGGGSWRGKTYALFGMQLSPFGLDPAIVAHERTHFEVHARIGLLRQLFGALPVWFDEGLAVLASGDERYLRPPGAGDRCRAEPRDDLPDGAADWARRAAVDAGLYASAACRVLRWGEGHGGRAGLLGLVAAIGRGRSFDDVWGRPATSGRAAF